VLIQHCYTKCRCVCSSPFIYIRIQLTTNQNYIQKAVYKSYALMGDSGFPLLYPSAFMKISMFMRVTHVHKICTCDELGAKFQLFFICMIRKGGGCSLCDATF